MILSTRLARFLFPFLSVLMPAAVSTSVSTPLDGHCHKLSIQRDINFEAQCVELEAAPLHGAEHKNLQLGDCCASLHALRCSMSP